MITAEHVEGCKKIVEHYGKEPQMRQAMEECSELIQAINKLWRKEHQGDDQEISEALDKVVGEMADVQIMLLQMFIMLDVDPECWEQEIDQKIARQLKRMEENPW